MAYKLRRTLPENLKKEATMTIKIIIERQFKDTPKAEIISILNDLRIRAMGQPGYISGETLVEVENNKNLVVLSNWTSIDDWQTWRDSAERSSLEAKLSPHLEGQAKVRVFMLGADSLREILTEVIHNAELAA